jgi:hypothetical protein
MGLLPAPEKCFITGTPTQNHPSKIDSIEYSIGYNGNQYFFDFSVNIDWESNLLQGNRFILQALLFNNEWPLDKETSLVATVCTVWTTQRTPDVPQSLYRALPVNHNGLAAIGFKDFLETNDALCTRRCGRVKLGYH